MNGLQPNVFQMNDFVVNGDATGAPVKHVAPVGEPPVATFAVGVVTLADASVVVVKSLVAARADRAAAGGTESLGNGNTDNASSAQEAGRWLNRAENSHQPFRRRQRAMPRFRQMHTPQKFCSARTSVHNHFDQARHLIGRQDYNVKRP